VVDATPVALELSGIVKEFGAVRALDGVSLSLAAGEIHALCGENGAGKSTLAAIAARKLGATAGNVEGQGEIGLVHQHFELVDRLRVWENVLLGREPRRGLRIDAAAAREHVRDLARRYGLDVDPDAVIENLPVGIAQRVEILRELAREPKVLILDEPTAVLASTEIDALFATLRTLAKRGIAIMVITHKLREVIGNADRVTVLREGRVVLSEPTAATSLAAIAYAMVGGKVPAIATRNATRLQPAFDVRNLCSGTGAHALYDATFEVRGGEIVGIAGVEGNGQSALTDAIAGIAPYAGTMTLRERPFVGSPAARIAAGARIIPQDRQREALVLEWSIAENAALGDHTAPELRRGWNIDRAARDRRARRIVERFDVRAASIDASTASLSGGNQQKVVVGRALAGEPIFVVAYQPTRGIDVGAAALVQSRLVESRNEGTAVLLISFELDELFAVADRILVMFRGRIAGEFAREAFDRSRIGALMSGAA
jgi:simple sugar transport system ATP-binding protein